RASSGGAGGVPPLNRGARAGPVLVGGGWIAAPAGSGAAPPVRTPPGAQRIDGIALERLPRALGTGVSPAGSVRQNLDIAAYAAETGPALVPMATQQPPPDAARPRARAPP